jgi:glycerophosphoryl diester phosphodiesterase
MPELRHYNPIWLTTQPIAHRGLHGPGVPENSLGAFQAAASTGYAVEFDIRLDAGRLIVAHDKPTPAAAAGAPTLGEALSTIHGRVPIAIEIKWPAAMLQLGPLLVHTLADYDGEVALTSFDPRILLWLRRHAPNLPCVQIAGTVPESRRPYLLKLFLRAMPLNFLTRPQAIGFDIRDYPTWSVLFWQRRLSTPIVLWTVKTPEDLAFAKLHHLNFLFDNLRP